MKTITFEGAAWAHERNLPEVMAGTIRPTSVSLFGFDASNMGYIRVGTARMEVEVMDESALRQSTAESIRKQIDKVRAESQNAITELTRKLNEVLAIECSESVGSEA